MVSEAVVLWLIVTEVETGWLCVQGRAWTNENSCPFYGVVMLKAGHLFPHWVRLDWIVLRFGQQARQWDKCEALYQERLGGRRGNA